MDAAPWCARGVDRCAQALILPCFGPANSRGTRRHADVQCRRGRANSSACRTRLGDGQQLVRPLRGQRPGPAAKDQAAGQGASTRLRLPAVGRPEIHHPHPRRDGAIAASDQLLAGRRRARTARAAGLDGQLAPDGGRMVTGTPGIRATACTRGCSPSSERGARDLPAPGSSAGSSAGGHQPPGRGPRQHLERAARRSRRTRIGREVRSRALLRACAAAAGWRDPSPRRPRRAGTAASVRRRQQPLDLVADPPDRPDPWRPCPSPRGRQRTVSGRVSGPAGWGLAAARPRRSRPRRPSRRCTGVSGVGAPVSGSRPNASWGRR